jgi:hypothetical protein
MANSKPSLSTWIIVASVCSAFYSLSGLLNLSLASPNSAPVYWFCFLVATLGWAGVILALEGQYSAAKVMLWIGGIVAFPLGLVMIRAGSRIKQMAAADPGRNREV